MVRPAAWVLRVTLLLASAATAARASAQRTSSLSWVRLAGAEGCISTQALAERVEQRVGRRVFVSASQADLSLEGHIERVSKPSAWLATLVVSDRQGHVLGRRFLRSKAERCEELEASLVLVITIAIDPNASLDEGASAAGGLSPQAKAMLGQLGLPELSEQQLREELTVPLPTPAVSERTDDTKPKTPSRARAPPKPKPGPNAPESVPGQPHVALFARITAELGVEPALGGGAVLGASVNPAGPLMFDLWITAQLPQRQRFTPDQLSVRYTFFAAGFGLCPVFAEAKAWAIRACAGARVGLVSAAGSGFSVDTTSYGPWVEPLAYAVATWRFGRWGLEAVLGPGFPIVRDTFAFQNRTGAHQTAHRASGVTGRVELGASLRF